jgi:hypothetical protein
MGSASLLQRTLREETVTVPSNVMVVPTGPGAWIGGISGVFYSAWSSQLLSTHTGQPFHPDLYLGGQAWPRSQLLPAPLLPASAHDREGDFLWGLNWELFSHPTLMGCWGRVFSSFISLI